MGLALGGSVLVVAPAVVHGATAFSIENIGGSVGLGTSDLREVAINVIKWLLGILGLVAVSFLIYGGFLWLTAAGNEERIEKAKRVIVNAVIGLVIVLLSWAIVLYVARFVTGATSGDGNPPGCATPPCAGGLPPVADFRVKDIQTAHVIGSGGNNLDVLRCSGVQPIFNNRSSSSTIAAVLPPNPTQLKVFKDVEGYPEVSGSWAYGNQAFMTFSLAPDVKYDKNSNYKVWIPKNILDESRIQLTECVADGTCTELDTKFQWLFSVGEQDDVAAPSVTTTYPIRNGVGYPDTNVSREPVLTVNFSETINLSTVLPGTNTIVQKITGSTPVPDASWTVVTGGPLDVSPQDGIIDADVFDPSDNGANGFDLHLAQQKRFEPFTWYRITVKNIKDLCGNSMSGTVTWDFKTNDTVAGIESFNPTGGGQCTDQRDVFVVFTVPMNGNKVEMKINGGNFDDVALFPGQKSYTGTNGVFTIVNTPNPVDNGWRVYKYTAKEAWPINQTFTIDVTTDRQVDTSGNTINQSWSFTTAAPDQCSCTPYIATLDPGSGGKEQCLSIIGSCFAGTADHAATPRKPEFALTFGTPPDPSPPPQGVLFPNGTSSNAIVTKVPVSDKFHVADLTGGDPSVRVTIDYTEPTFGTKTSNIYAKYHFSTNEASVGPCLVSLDKYEGFVGDANVAHGEDFLAQGGQSEVNYNPGNPASVPPGPPSGWTNTAINHVVPGAEPAPQSQTVRVTDKNGKDSNPLQFSLKDVSQLAPDAATPVVASVAPNCGDACTNAGLTVQYYLGTGGMNPLEVKLPANYQIKECTDATCLAFTDTAFTPNNFSLSFDAALPKITTVGFGKDRDFNVSTSYRVIISKNVKSDTGKELGNLNYDDDGDLTNDSYTWIFKTKTTNCVLQSVSVSPPSATLTAKDQTQSFVATARGPVSNCSANGDVIDPGSLGWSWSANRPETPLNSPFVLNQAVFRADRETVPGSSTVRASATQGSVNATGTASLIVDFAHCTDDTDCDNSGQCTGSTCDEDTHRCSPVIKSFSPPDGKIGTWVTVNGCYFGSYGPNSRMIFADNKDGIGFSNAPFCPGLAETWTDTAVTREVPNQTTPDTADDAVSGPIKIVRNTDGLSDATNTNPGSALPDYVVNTTERPGLCALVPNCGLPGDSVTLKGHNFGLSRIATDKVKFDTVDVLDYIWNDPAGQTVGVVVPDGLQQPSVVPVHLENDGLASDSLDFCVNTTTTAPPPGAPTVVSWAPQSGSACRNSVVTAQFSKDMDQATLIAENVSLRPCTGGNCGTLGASVNGEIQTTSNSFTLFPGFLAQGQKYLVSIGTGVKSSQDVPMANAFTWQFTTADTDSPCQLQSISVTLNPGTPDNTAYHRFTSLKLPNNQDNQTTATAHAWAGQPAVSQEISKTPGVYNWVWNWTNDNPTFADYTAAPGDTSPVQIKPKANGRSTFTLTASPSVGFTGSFSTKALVDVELCDFPWKYQDTKLLDPVNTPLFNLFYCRGNGVAPTVPELADPLTKDPDASVGTCPPDEPALNRACVQREYFFKIKCPQVGPGADDLNAKYCPPPLGKQLDFDLGIRIFPNTPLRSPRGWFEKNFPAAGGSSARTVDSYSAISVGTTTYVAAPFPNGTNPFTSKIYLLSVKDSAPEVSRSIAADLLAHWQFETPSDPTLKAAIARDMTRVGDLRDLKTVIDSKITAGGSAPLLAAGSFIPGLSTSKWPSWGATLGAELNGALPTDPQNTFDLPDPDDKCKDSKGYEEATCWNQTSKTFFCPGGSHVYGYQASGSTVYGLYGNLEYINAPGSWANGNYNPCAGSPGGSSCACFNYLVGAGSVVAVIDKQPPSAPGSVSARAENESSIRVSWMPSIDLGSRVEGYELTMNTQPVGTFTPPASVPGIVNSTSVLVTGLNSGTPYYFQVKAKDSAGNFSTPGAPATGEFTAPGNISSFSSQ